MAIAQFHYINFIDACIYCLCSLTNVDNAVLNNFTLALFSFYGDKFTKIECQCQIICR